MISAVCSTANTRQGLKRARTTKELGSLILIVALAKPLVVVALIWFLGIAHYYSSDECEFAEKFRTVSLGESKADVVALLGKPNGEGKEFDAIKGRKV